MLRETRISMLQFVQCERDGQLNNVETFNYIKYCTKGLSEYVFSEYVG